jgi:hypothetical protein
VTQLAVGVGTGPQPFSVLSGSRAFLSRVIRGRFCMHSKCSESSTAVQVGDIDMILVESLQERSYRAIVIIPCNYPPLTIAVHSDR